jgi:hypothetical protein
MSEQKRTKKMRQALAQAQRTADQARRAYLRVEQSLTDAEEREQRERQRLVNR